jgi:two-component system sensor histidine kinase KdpD
MTRIFDKFYRVQHSRSGGQAQGKGTSPFPTPTVPPSLMGSGLGLAVCKGLVEANGGHIQAELREDGGLVVAVTLPEAVSYQRIVP